jgi:hypothetical protein
MKRRSFSQSCLTPRSRSLHAETSLAGSRTRVPPDKPGRPRRREVKVNIGLTVVPTVTLDFWVFSLSSIMWIVVLGWTAAMSSIMKIVECDASPARLVSRRHLARGHLKSIEPCEVPLRL